MNAKRNTASGTKRAAGVKAHPGRNARRIKWENREENRKPWSPSDSVTLTELDRKMAGIDAALTHTLAKETQP